MAQIDSVKTRLAARTRQSGIFINTASAISAELAAGCGFDVVLLDHEHSAGDFITANACINAVKGTPAEIWMRIPSHDAAYIKRSLDCGAIGIMCPMVNSADDARWLVGACRYPPHGTRGVAPLLAHCTAYGLNKDAYLAELDQRLVVMPQIETREGAGNVAAIAGVAGIDVVFIGPADLAASLGHFGDINHPEVVDTILRVEEIVKKSGKALGTLAMAGNHSPEALVKRGYDLIFTGSDIGVLRAGMQQQVAGLRQLSK